MSAGFHIFPLYRFKTNGLCECADPECPAIGKHPRASSWQHTPMWDDEQIGNMEMAGHLDTGYGALCRGHIIVDVDARNGGVESYKKLRALVPEVDDAGLTVNTGSGGGSQHLYFKAPEGVSLVTHLPEYPGIDFKSSGYVVGPGSAHKSGGVYTADGYPEDIGDAPAALIDLLKRPERHRSEFNGHAVDLAHSDIQEMLGHVTNSDLPYEDWLAIGMAIHHATQGSGFDLWDAWSATSGKHDSKQMQYKWGSFGRSANPVTIGTLIHHAEQGGWVMPVTFVPDQQFADEPDAPVDGLPFDIAGVDLTAPPGFVGEVAKWMDACSSRPRKHIAVAAALTTIGNIGGLRYVDDISGVTANLFAFCVAGAGTGKGAIQKASAALMREAGIAAASHGSIKSEQEMIRNLIRHQASFYSIDEVGIFLGKIDNAKKKGGASYLEGIPGMMMSAYSLADDWMGISGDLKESTRADLVKELGQIEAALDKGETPFLLSRKASRERFLRTLDNGIERPFVSMMGFTTPSTFGDTISADNVANGFIRRCLIFNERETVPRTRGVWQKPTVPDGMANYVRAIWSGGEYDSQAFERVENYTEPSKLPSATDAVAFLERCKEWFEEAAEDSKSTSGLESLYIGAYELVAKVSLILGIPEQLRTAEHVRWAFALVKRDIEDKVNLVTANDKVKSAPKTALRSALLALIGDTPFKEGAIFNRLDSKFKRDDILAELGVMVKKGLIEVNEKTHARNKTVFRTYVAP